MRTPAVQDELQERCDYINNLAGNIVEQVSQKARHDGVVDVGDVGVMFAAISGTFLRSVMEDEETSDDLKLATVEDAVNVLFSRIGYKVYMHYGPVPKDTVLQ